MSSTSLLITARSTTSSSSTTTSPAAAAMASVPMKNQESVVIPGSTTGSQRIVPPPSSWYDDDDDDHDCPVLPPDTYPSDDSEKNDNESNGDDHENLNHLHLSSNDCDEDVFDESLLLSEPTRHSSSSSNNNTTTTTILRGGRVVVRPAPSWYELSRDVVPAAARELWETSVHVLTRTTRLGYAKARWKRQYSEMQSTTFARGYQYYYYHNQSNSTSTPLPRFSSLPWVDRQLVAEWRTYGRKIHTTSNAAITTNTTTSPDIVAVPEEDEEEMEFATARTLVPTLQPRPIWKTDDACAICRRGFGPTQLRHHCRNCGNSVCGTHSPYTHPLPHLGYTIPERACVDCHAMLVQQDLAERVAWRLARCRDWLQQQQQQQGDLSSSSSGEFMPYFEVGIDGVEDIALRISHAAIALAKAIPLGAQATVAVETVDLLRKYGLHGIYTIMLRQEFLAAADLLLQALGINRRNWPISVHELSAAIFYALAQFRALRGVYPEREHQMHATITTNTTINGSDRTTTPIGTKANHSASKREPNLQNEVVEDETDDNDETSWIPVCESISDAELQSLIWYAPIALHFIYAEKEVYMQLLAAQQGWRLVYAYLRPYENENFLNGHHHKNNDRPASALFVHEESKIACLAVRGTTTIHDVITDIRQTPVPFPEDPVNATAGSVSSVRNSGVNQKSTTGAAAVTVDEEWTTVFRGNGLAVAGMATAAVNLYWEHIDSLMLLAQQGYRIRMTGHSLGGAVATLLGVLVYKDLADLNGQQYVGPTTEAEAPLKVYAYGTPSCVDFPLAEAVNSFVTTVVLHDDVVPRLTLASCRGLLKHLLHIRETWVKEHFADDVRAFTDRAKTAWAPRWRGGFTLTSSSSVKLKRYCRKQIQKGKKQLRIVKDKLVGDDKFQGTSETTVAEPVGSLPHFENIESVTVSTQNESDLEKAGAYEPRLVVDYLGSMDARYQGLVVDGDEFFDPEGSSLVESSVDQEDGQNGILGDCMVRISTSVDESNSSYFNEIENTENEKKIDDTSEESPGTVILDEIPLPQMFIPGKIVHIYSHRGVYRAAFVPRRFRELRRISPAGNMLSDHRTKSYYDALLEVSSVRQAPEDPPVWTAFDEDDTCSCCASPFTWASTSDNEAQEARDKHNCRSCGSLVCQPCSSNRTPVPSIGLTVPSRVCDRCYNDTVGLLSQSNWTNCANNCEDGSGKPVRSREKRSTVVDELASKVHGSVLTCFN